MSNNSKAVIKNSILYYGMPMTGKSTRLQEIFLNTLKQSHGRNEDVVINLWQFLHRSQYWAKRGTTSTYVRSPHGVIPAIPISFNPMNWMTPLQKFHARFPNAPHILLDECYCISAVYLDALIMCCRDLWPNAQVVMGSIDFDSWHHRMSNIDAIRKMAEKSVHLDHKCMLDYNRVATRRLHIIKQGKSTWTPYYNERKYDQMISKPKYHNRATMISVCYRHYHLSTTQLNQLLKMNAKLRKKPTWHFNLQYRPNNVVRQAQKQIQQNKKHAQKKSSKSKRTRKTRRTKRTRKTKKSRKSTRAQRTKRTRRTKSTRKRKTSSRTKKSKRTRRTRKTKRTRKSRKTGTSKKSKK